MRLSDAMMLGSVTCRMEKYNWNSCALGCAGNAVGIPNWGNVGRKRHDLIFQAWPWLLERCHCAMCLAVTVDRIRYQGVAHHETYCDHITAAFDGQIVYGEMTLEALIDWVRSVEPQPLGLPAPVEARTGMDVEEQVAAL